MAKVPLEINEIFWAQIALASLVANSGPKKVSIVMAHPFQLKPYPFLPIHV